MMKEYKPIILSLIKFFSVYLILIGIYYLYLNYFHEKLVRCDPFTEIVAGHSSYLLNLIGISSETKHLAQENFIRFFINNKFVSYVNEGCNALSVIILYLSFIIAFASGWIKTSIFLVVTIPLIYLSNIIRVAFINYIFYYHHEYGKDFHDYIFPTIIYGIIILFWFIWIKFFVFSKK